MIVCLKESSLITTHSLLFENRSVISGCLLVWMLLVRSDTSPSINTLYHVLFQSHLTSRDSRSIKVHCVLLILLVIAVTFSKPCLPRNLRGLDFFLILDLLNLWIEKLRQVDMSVELWLIDLILYRYEIWSLLLFFECFVHDIEIFGFPSKKSFRDSDAFLQRSSLILWINFRWGRETKWVSHDHFKFLHIIFSFILLTQILIFWGAHIK